MSGASCFLPDQQAHIPVISLPDPGNQKQFIINFSIPFIIHQQKLCCLIKSACKFR